MQVKQSVLALLLLNIALMASKCSDDLGLPDYGGTANAGDPIVQPYGAVGTVTPNEAIVVRGLVPNGAIPDADGIYRFAQPQSRNAITSRIGFPASYEGNSDHYQLETGTAEIIYDASGYAIGVRQNK